MVVGMLADPRNTVPGRRADQRFCGSTTAAPSTRATIKMRASTGRPAMIATLAISAPGTRALPAPIICTNMSQSLPGAAGVRSIPHHLDSRRHAHARRRNAAADALPRAAGLEQRPVERDRLHGLPIALLPHPVAPPNVNNQCRPRAARRPAGHSHAWSPATPISSRRSTPSICRSAMTPAKSGE